MSKQSYMTGLKTDDLEKIDKIRRSLEPGKKIVFISGILNVVHSGHLRLFNFAKECGDILVVGVRPDDYPGAILEENIRLEGVKALSVVDEAFIISSPLEKILQHLKPDVIVKGKEHEGSENLELEIAEKLGGKLLFGSSDSRFSTIELLRSESTEDHLDAIQKPHAYPERHEFTPRGLQSLVRKFANLNVVVIGDLIVDEYVSCEALGMSQEDPTLVVSPITSSSFLGGAGIVAAHARGLGGNAQFFTITGHDTAASFAAEKLEEYGVDHFLIADATRPTTLKKRYRALDKTLLRVNELRQHEINKEVAEQMLAKITPVLETADLLIFSDFNYGCLPQPLVEEICNLCQINDIMMVADSQSSSQIGDISRYKDMNLVTPTEREARLAVRDFSAGLVELVTKLQDTARPKHVITTLGSEGILIQTIPETEKDLRTDRLNAMNTAPKDVAGGGDSMLVASAMTLAAGGTIWEAGYIGSLAAAFQVGRIGNIPLSADELIREIGR